jgi:hypothetical protein
MRTIRKNKKAATNINSFKRRIFLSGKYLFFLYTNKDIRQRTSKEIKTVTLLKPNRYEKIQDI